LWLLQNGSGSSAFRWKMAPRTTFGSAPLEKPEPESELERSLAKHAFNICMVEQSCLNSRAKNITQMSQWNTLILADRVALLSFGNCVAFWCAVDNWLGFVWFVTKTCYATG
jgi:hypothetical protein